MEYLISFPHVEIDLVDRRGNSPLHCALALSPKDVKDTKGKIDPVKTEKYLRTEIGKIECAKKLCSFRLKKEVGKEKVGQLSKNKFRG